MGETDKEIDKGIVSLIRRYIGLHILIYIDRVAN